MSTQLFRTDSSDKKDKACSHHFGLGCSFGDSCFFSHSQAVYDREQKEILQRAEPSRRRRPSKKEPKEFKSVWGNSNGRIPPWAKVFRGEEQEKSESEWEHWSEVDEQKEQKVIYVPQKEETTSESDDYADLKSAISRGPTSIGNNFSESEVSAEEGECPKDAPSVSTKHARGRMSMPEADLFRIPTPANSPITRRSLQNVFSKLPGSSESAKASPIAAPQEPEVPEVEVPIAPSAPVSEMPDMSGELQEIKNLLVGMSAKMSQQELENGALRSMVCDLKTQNTEIRTLMNDITSHMVKMQLALQMDVRKISQEQTEQDAKADLWRQNFSTLLAKAGEKSIPPQPAPPVLESQNSMNMRGNMPNMPNIPGQPLQLFNQGLLMEPFQLQQQLPLEPPAPMVQEPMVHEPLDWKQWQHQASFAQEQQAAQTNEPMWPDQKILILGDGNLTFALAVAERRHTMGLSNRNLWASTFDEDDTFIRRYREQGRQTIQRLNELGVMVVHSLDARVLHQTPGLPKFDVIIWNYPHAGAIKGFEDHHKLVKWRHVNLVREFFYNAHLVLSPNGVLKLSYNDGAGGCSKRELLSAAGKYSWQIMKEYPYELWGLQGYQRVYGDYRDERRGVLENKEVYQQKRGTDRVWEFMFTGKPLPPLELMQEPSISLASKLTCCCSCGLIAPKEYREELREWHFGDCGVDREVLGQEKAEMLMKLFQMIQMPAHRFPKNLHIRNS